MDNIVLRITISFYLFQIGISAPSANSTFEDLVSSNLSLSIEKSTIDTLERLRGTKFCESILSPTGYTLRKSLYATFLSGRNDTYFDGNDSLDFCCRSLYKCDAYKRVEVNYSTNNNFQHCECVHSFRNCLKKVNTALSNGVVFIHSINTTKCYAEYHPIIKCVKFEDYSGPTDQDQKFLSSSFPHQFVNRCTKYEFNESQPRTLQLMDLPFVNSGMRGVNYSECQIIYSLERQ